MLTEASHNFWLTTFVLGIFFLALFLPSPGQCQKDAPIILYGNIIKPPKTWDDNGTPRGILIDILDEIAKRTGLKFNIQMRPWARAYEHALAGEGGVYGLSMTKERLSIFDYSEPIFHDEILLVTRKGKEFPFNSMGDLGGKRIGVTRGAIYGDKYQEALNTVFVPIYSSDPAIRLRMLLEGRVDVATVGPGKAGLFYYLNTDPFLIGKADQFVCLEKPLIRDPNFIGFHKSLQRKDTIKVINEAIRAMRKEGLMGKIIKKYEYSLSE